MFLLFVETAAVLFVPAVVGLLLSEYLGWHHGMPDAVTQGLWIAVKQTTWTGKVLSLVLLAVLGQGYQMARQWVDHRLRTDVATFQLPADPTTHSIVCSADSLANQSFTGNVAGTDVILRIDAVQSTESGSEIRYSVLHGGDMRSDGRAFFDNATCTLRGIPSLVSPGHVVQTGMELKLVAVEPRWELRHYATR